MKNLLHLLLMGALISFTACSENKTEDDSMEAAAEENEHLENTVMEDDAEFAMEAADRGMLEVKLGELAQTNGVSQQVKDLGKNMSEDHAKSNKELEKWADQKNVSLPDRLSPESQEAYDQLAAKTGTDFDESYTDMMVKAHRKNIKMFEKQAERGNDADLKMWASEKLPVLNHHLQMAEEAEKAADKND